MDEFFTVSFIQPIFIENLIYVERCFVSRDIVVNKTVKNLYVPGLPNLWDETYNIEKFNKQTIYYIKRWLTFWRKIKLVDRNSWQPQASLKTWCLGQDLGRKLASLINTLGKRILGRKESKYKGGNLSDKLREQLMKYWMLWL